MYGPKTNSNPCLAAQFAEINVAIFFMTNSLIESIAVPLASGNFISAKDAGVRILIRDLYQAVFGALTLVITPMRLLPLMRET
jgi:hypothetical protein